MTTGLVKYMLDEIQDEGMSRVMGVLEDWHGALESICEIPKLVDDERQAAMLLLRRIEVTIKEVIHESENTLTTVTMTWMHEGAPGGERIMFKSVRGTGVNAVKLERPISNAQALAYCAPAFALIGSDTECDTVTFMHKGNRMDCLKD